jgi:hypothetical protein
LCPPGFTGDEIEGDSVARLQGEKPGLRHFAYMHEDIVAPVIAANEAEASFRKHFATSKIHGSSNGGLRRAGAGVGVCAADSRRRCLSMASSSKSRMIILNEIELRRSLMRGRRVGWLGQINTDPACSCH